MDPVGTGYAVVSVFISPVLEYQEVSRFYAEQIAGEIDILPQARRTARSDDEIRGRVVFQHEIEGSGKVFRVRPVPAHVRIVELEDASHVRFEAKQLSGNETNQMSLRRQKRIVIETNGAHPKDVAAGSEIFDLLHALHL